MPLTSAEVATIAALGSSALTGLASLGVVAYREWRRGKAHDRDDLRTAIGELLSRSMAVSYRAITMGQTMKTRSGLKEGLDIVFHHRKPVDPMELHDWMAQDLVPLHAALDQIWTRWDQEGIRLANDVVGKCVEVLGVSTATTPVGTGLDRARIWAAGERWTPEMIAANEEAVKQLAHARKRLADYARATLGLPAADLFAQVAAVREDAKAIDAAEASEQPAEADDLLAQPVTPAQRAGNNPAG